MNLSDRDVLSRIPYERIADLDPLEATPWLVRLPDMNRQADTQEIQTTLRAILPSIQRASRMDPFEAAAATRDLGMLLASLKRHGVEPVEAVPEVEGIMLMFGERTHMAPRETVFHYSLWNPTGPRQRRFTDDASEAGLVDAVRLTAQGIEATVDLLARACTLPPASGEFAQLCMDAARQLEQLAEAMKLVRRNVDPLFFATRLRPYFEEIRLGGRQYSGAAAAPLSVGVIDHLLWSSDSTDPRYRDFQSHTMQYGLPRGRRLYKASLGQPSIVTRFIEARRNAEATSQAFKEGARALDAIFKVLLAFRGRHTVIAKTAYQETIRRYPVGSAGYGMDTLTLILQRTKDARQKILAEA